MNQSTRALVAFSFCLLLFSACSETQKMERMAAKDAKRFCTCSQPLMEFQVKMQNATLKPEEQSVILKEVSSLRENMEKCLGANEMKKRVESMGGEKKLRYNKMVAKQMKAQCPQTAKVLGVE